MRDKQNVRADQIKCTEKPDSEVNDILHREMNHLGYMMNENGKYEIVPKLIPFTYDLWIELTGGKEEPFQAFSAQIPKLQSICLSRLAEKLQMLPACESIRKSGSLSVFEDLLNENAVVTDDPETWLNAPVRINLGVTVDSYADYMLHVTYPAYGWQDYEGEYASQFRNSGIMWLTRRQGYKQAQLRQAQHLVEKACREKDPLSVISSPYLYSAAMEIWHELSLVNQLGFFLLVPLREALLMETMKRWGEREKKWPGYLLLDKSTPCGFFSTSDGSCSLLGIQMEKDLKVPLRDVEIWPDGANGYAMIDVHGNPGKWKAGCIKSWGFHRSFRKSSEKFGISALPVFTRGGSRITIRSATPADAKRLLEIYSYYVENTAISFEYDVPSEEEFRGRIENTLRKFPYLVLEENDEIAGYAYAGVFKGRAAYDHSCELSIYLDKERKGKGFGRLLYEALERELKKRGFRNLYACIGDPVTEDEYLTRNSEHFHEHMGFVKVGTFHLCGYKFGRWYNMIWMEKLIGEHLSDNQSEK